MPGVKSHPTGTVSEMKILPGLTFSWKRAVGLTAAKSKISRTIKVPLTRSGRQRKLGKLLDL